MSAETLRRAAALMRERAEASLSPSPWHAEDNSVWDADEHLVIASNVDILDDDIPHIASWHPAAALAVAVLLDSHADIHTLRTCDERLTVPCPAITVACAYLGESS